MRIGLTYDLKDDHLATGASEEEVAEFDSRETIESVAAALASLGHQVVAIGDLRRLLSRLLAGERWDLVFNLAEGTGGFGREAQVPAVLEAYDLPYVFSDPLTLAVSLHKGMAKSVVRDAGVPTPDFAVVEEIGSVHALDLPFPLFAKPVAEGSSRGISMACRVEDRARLEAVCAELLARYRQPVLVEQYLPGADLTVGLLGAGSSAEVLGVMEVVLGPQAEPEIYSYRNKTVWEGIVSFRRVDGQLAERAAAIAGAAWRALGGRDAGRVDLKLDAAGNPWFLEVNPLAGLRPDASDLTILAGLHGIAYGELVGRVLGAAQRRLGLVEPRLELASGVIAGEVA